MKPAVTIWHWLTLASILLPPLYLAYAWPLLPAQLPTHFGLDGQPDGFTAKHDMWLLCLGLPLSIYLLLTFLPRFDPKRRLKTDQVNYQKLRLALTAMSGALAASSIYAGLHPGLTGEPRTLGLVSLFFAFWGNYLPTVPPNYFLGIRTPWAMEFPDNWHRTHRLAGRLFLLTGLVGLVLAVAAPVAWANLGLAVTIGLSVVAVYGYSYWLYYHLQQTTR